MSKPRRTKSVEAVPAKQKPMTNDSVTSGAWRTETDRDYTLEKNRVFFDYFAQQAGSFSTLDRTHLHDTSVTIEARDWSRLLLEPEDLSLEALKQFKRDYLADGNKPEGPSVPDPEIGEMIAQAGARPLMFCEYGFGHTTFLLLDYCTRHNGYLVSVDMPIAPEAKLNAGNMDELFYWGVDRYFSKHDWCVKLQEQMKKRWLWINDDIFDVSTRIVEDISYREKLFLGGKIDFFMDDAIHEFAFAKSFHDKLRPHMSTGGLFFGGHNHQRWG